MIERFVLHTVEFCQRRAPYVVGLSVLAAIFMALFAINRLGLDTDVTKLLSSDLPWRQREIAFDKAFPQNTDLLAIVVDGATPELAEAAAAGMAAKLAQRPDLFRTVRRPDGGPFFARNGVLFLSVEEIQTVADRLIEAQPLLGTLAGDPTLRGLLSSLNLAIEGRSRGLAKIETIKGPLATLADLGNKSLAAPEDAYIPPLSWQTLLTGRPAEKIQLQRFILAQPVLDYTALSPGARASDFVREAAVELGYVPDRGVRIRLTGPIAMSDEEFASVSEGIGLSSALSIAGVFVMLLAALRSARMIAAILVTLIVGLIATAAFAALAVRELNLISVAFGVLFVGIAVDFGIQVTVAYRDARYREHELGAALRRTARRLAGPLTLAAATTSIGFLSFLPTDYRGVSELGLIAGTGMVIALVLNLTLLPALIALFRPGGEQSEIGWASMAPLDHFLLHRRRAVLAVAALLAIAASVTLPRLAFDFNPINLRDPSTESVSTLLELMQNPDTTPYTLDVLTPSVDAARVMADRLAGLPEVARALSISSYIPEDQAPKLAILNDAAMLVGPTLQETSRRSEPDENELRSALTTTAAKLRALPSPDPVELRFATMAEQIAAAPAPVLRRFEAAVLSGLPQQLAQIRSMLQAGPVTLQDLPEDLTRAWIAQDGRARVEVYPRGDTRNNKALRKFVEAVQGQVPDVTGSAVSIQESSRTIVQAFVTAGLFSTVAIAIVLIAVLRRFRDVVLVLLPLLLAGLLTLATTVLIGLPLNFANIIALPLLLGIGVAFDIYFVMNWRAGLAAPLQSATTRAVVFSAATTAVAFAALTMSRHPGTADMGVLLLLELGFTLLCTLLVMPALLGRPRSVT